MMVLATKKVSVKSVVAGFAPRTAAMAAVVSSSVQVTEDGTEALNSSAKPASSRLQQPINGH